MKKSYFLYLALTLSSASTLANVSSNLLDVHLTTAGERSSAATYQLAQAKLDERTPLEMQLTTSGNKTPTAGHVVQGLPDTSSQSVFDYHYTTTD